MFGKQGNILLQEQLIHKIAALSGSLYKKTEALSTAVLNTKDHEENIEERMNLYLPKKKGVSRNSRNTPLCFLLLSQHLYFIFSPNILELKS